LQMRAKAKVGKASEAKTAKNEYLEYVSWMKSMLGGGKYVKYNFRPPG